jgi:hypothetical protein
VAVTGLSWWAQKHWIDQQRRLWREHDATLAALWRGPVPGTVRSGQPRRQDRVIVLPDVLPSASDQHDTVRP